MKMLASASASWQVDATVFVAHRDWQAITAYERMWAVAAAYDYVERIQREYGRRRSLGLVSFGDGSPSFSPATSKGSRPFSSTAHCTHQHRARYFALQVYASGS